MGLLQLPSEVLAMIAEHSLPYFEDLSLTCRKLYNEITPARKRHIDLCKKYRNFSFTPSVAKVSDLLAEIAADPVIAAYIVNLDLETRQLCEDDEIDDGYIEQMNCKLAPLVYGSSHLSSLSDGQDGLHALWLREIVHEVDPEDKEDCQAEFGIAFLASLLVNVETLTMPSRWCNLDVMRGFDSTPPNPVVALLRLLVKNANDISLRCQPLQKLRVIKPSAEVDTQSGTDLELLLPFLALNSLRELHHWCAVFSSERREEMPFTALGRNLEVMRLEDYVIYSSAAKVLFSQMKKLRVFEMEYSMKDEEGYRFDADAFFQYLIAGAGGSLEKLSLIGNQVWPDTQVLNSSLRGLTRLKHLELSTLFLVNGHGALGPGYGEEKFETEEEESDYEDEDEGEDEEGEDDQEDDQAHDEESEDGDGAGYEQEGNDIEGENDEDEGEAEISDREKEDTEDAEPDTQEWSDGEEDQDEPIYDVPEGFTRVYNDYGTYNDILGFHPEDYQAQYRNGNTVWRLISSLPETLETLVIHTPAAPRNSACVERMFFYFEELRAERLPNLKRIEVIVNLRSRWGELLEGGDDEVARLRAFFADKDIVTKFEVYDDVTHWINRDRPTWW